MKLFCRTHIILQSDNTVYDRLQLLACKCSYAENIEKWESFEKDYELNDAELKYYPDATVRINEFTMYAGKLHLTNEIYIKFICDNICDNIYIKEYSLIE